MSTRFIIFKTFLNAAVGLSGFLGGSAYSSSTNLSIPPTQVGGSFAVQAVAEFQKPWALAFLPDGRILVTEERGSLFLVTPRGGKSIVGNLPVIDRSGGDGLLDVAPAPDFARTSRVFFSYVEPGRRLVLASASLVVSSSGSPTLTGTSVIWRQNVSGGGTHTGGVIVFDPQGEHVFLTVGDFGQPETAQDPQQARGKVLRLNLDGTPPADNPTPASGGVPAQTWTTGHRNPYGLEFAPDGRLWLHEMGPRGGDEVNLVERGRNYGWPLVSEGDQYSGTPIPRHASRPQFAAPAAYWSPVVSPAGLVFYRGEMFASWQGSALIGGLSTRSLIRVSFKKDDTPRATESWDMGARIRDVAVAADGAVWVIEDAELGRLLRLTPQRATAGSAR
jgi:glucose/arabinose dehydrogenase